MMRVTRRETMAMLAAGSALSAVPALARPRAPCPVTVPLDAVTEALLAHLPETATYNGVASAADGGPLARRMDDYSPTGDAAWRGALRDAGSALARMGCDGDPIGALRLAVAREVVANGARTTAIPYGRPNPFWFSGHTPYLVTQISGPHIDTPNVMQAQQPVSTPAEVDGWIEKLDGYERGFSGVIDKLRADEAAGCRPPRILLEKALPVLAAFLAGDPAHHPLVTSLRDRMAQAALDAGLRETAGRRAITALERSARPAIARLRDQIAAMIPRARATDGVWAQPDGDALYAANVRSLGDTRQPPAEIHRIGLTEVRRITAEMDRLLRTQGLARGSVGQRMIALGDQPRFQFADSDAGRAAALEHIRRIVHRIEARQAEFLPRALIPRQHLEVRRVPPAIEAGAPGAYYDGPSLDGARPGIYWINLRDMKSVARFKLPTVTYHEGVPGHHMQGAIALAQGDAPLIMRIASFNAYQEGWALYAEHLAAEIGCYRGDTPGNLGRLQDELVRAVRLVVDTGIHHHRWSREKAIAYARAATGNPLSEVTAEIERYMAWPGQALGYKLGQLRLLALRAAAARRLGKRFDRRRFHAIVLRNGAMPLDRVADAVDAFAGGGEI